MHESKAAMNVPRTNASNLHGCTVNNHLISLLRQFGVIVFFTFMVVLTASRLSYKKVLGSLRNK